MRRWWSPWPTPTKCSTLVNRPGNVVSHEGCVPWIDRAIKLVAPLAGQITLRGDTDFTLSAELDRWDEQGVKFISGWMLMPRW